LPKFPQYTPLVRHTCPVRKLAQKWRQEPKTWVSNSFQSIFVHNGWLRGYD